MRTANRNNHLLLNFLEKYVCSKNGADYSLEELEQFTSNYISKENVNQYFNKIAIHFGKWLLNRNPRTLEHSIEELFEMYYDEIISAPNEFQVDHNITDLPSKIEYDTHAPGSCPM